MPNIHNISKNFYAYASFNANLADAGAVGAAGNRVDALLYRRAALTQVVHTGGSTGITIKLQESSDDITYTDVSTGTFVAIGASVNVTTIMDIDLSKRLRYLRAYYTNTGTPVGYASATFLLYEPFNTDAITQSSTAIVV